MAEHLGLGAGWQKLGCRRGRVRRQQGLQEVAVAAKAEVVAEVTWGAGMAAASARRTGGWWCA